MLTPSHLVDRLSDIVRRPGDSRGVKTDVKRSNKAGSSTRSRLRNENDGLDRDIKHFTTPLVTVGWDLIAAVHRLFSLASLTPEMPSNSCGRMNHELIG